MKISSICEISAVYFALLQRGYDYYAMARDEAHVESVRRYANDIAVSDFFRDVRQDTCEVYPYWPRASLLEGAVFYLDAEGTQFNGFDKYREKIMKVGNLSDRERDHRLWKWIIGFPEALRKVMADENFARYLAWEKIWIEEQNRTYANELDMIQRILDICKEKYDSHVRDIRIVINPIKCVFSADYHMHDGCFVFCSGRFSMDSVIHEFLHHLVHPVVCRLRNNVLTCANGYPGIDSSYYLDGDDEGRLNAFEEYAVRRLTNDVIENTYPDSIERYIDALTTGK